MISVSGDPPLVTDSDVHALTWEFVNSGYRGDQYANWPIERRLGRFLRRRGLDRHANNGDICNIILDRIMRLTGPRELIYGERESFVGVRAVAAHVADHGERA